MGYKILIVEDVPWEARLVDEILREAGLDCQLVHADRLDAAVSRLLAEHFDAVLLDLSLPDSRGLETVICMCAIVPDTPVLVLTGIEDGDMRREVLRLGAQDYLIKGEVDGWGLARAIDDARNRKHAEPRVQRQKELMGMAPPA